MTRRIRVLPWLLAAIAAKVSCQSPGPDWPGCAETSKYRHPGWEVLRLDFKTTNLSTDAGKYKLFDLIVDVQNAADGSRTICVLSKNDTQLAQGSGSQAVILTNSDGGCYTGWAGKYEEFSNSTRMAEVPASVTFNTQTREIAVSQVWNCAENENSRPIFWGSASSTLNFTCGNDREEPAVLCAPTDIDIITEPPIFIGPASTGKLSTSMMGSAGSEPEPDCPSLSSSPASWQILSMMYYPPTAQPEKSPYAPTSLRIELRSLVDGTRTLCYLETQDISDAETGIVLANKGATLSSDNYSNACSTGWLYDIPGTQGAQTKQAWRWLETADVSFNTKTHQLTINQTLACGMMGQKPITTFTGHAAQELKIDCVDTGNSFYPKECEPTTALYSASSRPVVIQ